MHLLYEQILYQIILPAVRLRDDYVFPNFDIYSTSKKTEDIFPKFPISFPNRVKRILMIISLNLKPSIIKGR